MALGCGSDCAPLSWDTLSHHTTWAAAMWAGFLLHGVALVVFGALNHVERLMQQVAVVRQRLHDSFIYVFLSLLVSLAQCVLFCMRTYNKDMRNHDVIVEIVASSLYALDLLPSWFLMFLNGIGPGLLFMISWCCLDCLLISSAFCIFTVKDSNGDKSWGSFSFLAALHALCSWSRLLGIFGVNLKVVRWQVVDITVSSICMVFFAAMTIMTLENLGDPDTLKPYNDEKWTTISSLYFVFVSVSTVGFGDLAPESVLGRTFTVVAILIGIAWLLIAVGNIGQAVSVQTQGGGYYTRTVRNKHIVITGNPTVQMVKDFLAELFHPDHADDAEDIIAIFLFPSSNPATAETIQSMTDHLKQKSLVRVRLQVRLYQGNVVEPKDLERVAAAKAAAVFVLPDTLCQDPLQEDTENIVRVMAMQRVAHVSAQIVLLLMKSENQRLLSEAGISGRGLTVTALDQFKMELVAKSCVVPGFSTFICNLCKSIEVDEDSSRDTRQIWQQEYERGIGQELYEVELSASYAERGAKFGEVVVDVLEQTGGTVYGIGVVETKHDGTKTVLINPGAMYPIKHEKTGVNTSAVFMAPDRDKVVQCEEGGVFLGRRERPRVSADEAMLRMATVSKRDMKAESLQEDKEINERLLAWLDKEQADRAKQLVSLVKRQQRAAKPARPPLKLLAKGGHILLCCVGAGDSQELALGLEHFVRPLRLANDDVVVPIVVLIPVIPSDWHSVVDHPDVYFLRGTPGLLFDLERANFKGASTIVICNASNNRSGSTCPQPWVVDAEVVCCARLVEGQLGPATKTQVITDLSTGENHTFLPVPPQDDVAVKPPPTKRRFSVASLASLTSYLSGGEDQKRKNLFDRRFSLNSRASVIMGSSSAEYYRQQRYACGQLFVGTIATSLVVNTFYNPSLCELVSKMISTDTTMVKVPREMVGKSYFEFFQHLLYMEGLMAIGIFRSVSRRVAPARRKPISLVGEEKGGVEADTTWMSDSNSSRLTSYVYTAPPGKATTMLASDRVLCFGYPLQGT